ncbi:hypothetical protein Bca101_020538 [Brassica carinata]
MNNYAEPPSFPGSLVGGHARPRRCSADPFSSPISGADREAIPMESLKYPRTYLLDDGPHSEIQEGDLMEIPRKYDIFPWVGIRCSYEYERAPDGGDNEMAVLEAYQETGFRGVIPFLVKAVSSYFGFCPSQLTPLTWRALIAIQVLGEFHGFSVGVHEVLYLYYFAPFVSKPRFYHLCSRDGPPLVAEPLRGLRGNYPSGDDWDKRYVFMKVPGPLSYPTFWRTVGNVVGLSVSAVYDEYQKGKTRKRRPFYVPPPRLARTIPRAASLSSSSPCNAEAAPNQDLETGAHQRLLGETAFDRWSVLESWGSGFLLARKCRPTLMAGPGLTDYRSRGS